MASTTDTGALRGEHGGVGGDRVSVLVVDDGAAFRRAAATVIAATEGFVLAGMATSGEEAIAWLERQRVALVLMDVCMPGIGGVCAAERIRRRFPDVVVVLLSMYRTAVVTDDTAFCDKDQFDPEKLEMMWREGRHARE